MAEATPPTASPTSPTSPARPPSLTVRGASVRTGGHELLKHINLVLHPGELCALIGPSGAGKSTLIKVLLGLRAPSDGELRLGDKEPADAGPIGYVPQDDALHTTLTVDRELSYAAELRLPQLDDDQRRKQVDRVVRAVGLEERRRLRIGRLSGGQRKRVSVALELLTAPRLLILDEPTSGLDPGLESTMMGLFADVAASGRMVLVATHAMESLSRCHALLLLMAGQVVFFGPPDKAPEHFGVDRFASIFSRLNERSAVAWGRAWAESPLKRPFLNRSPPALSPSTEKNAKKNAPSAKASAPSEVA